jgi:K+-sensing histidine kinase KdpD
MLHQRDFILRLIEQAGAAIAQLRARLGLGTSAEAEVVVREAEQAQAALFGSLWASVRVLDPTSAAMLVGDARQLHAWLDLMRVQAAAYEQIGATQESQALTARADALERAAPSAES